MTQMNCQKLTRKPCQSSQCQINGKSRSLASISAFRNVSSNLKSYNYALEFLTMSREHTFEQTVAQQNNLGDELIQLFNDDSDEFAKLFDQFYNRNRKTDSQ